MEHQADSDPSPQVKPRLSRPSILQPHMTEPQQTLPDSATDPQVKPRLSRPSIFQPHMAKVDDKVKLVHTEDTKVPKGKSSDKQGSSTRPKQVQPRGTEVMRFILPNQISSKHSRGNNENAILAFQTRHFILIFKISGYNIFGELK